MYIGNPLSAKDSFITKDFDEPILFAPARFKNGCNDLKIITAFTDCERISTHMIALSDGMKKSFVKDINVNIILGMTKSSLSEKKHSEICRLIKYLDESKNMPKISCFYINQGKEVHSKIYLWSKKDETMPASIIPNIAYCGSLNYTTNAFYKRRESVTVCNPFAAYFYYKELFEDSINCLNPIAIERIKNVTNGKSIEIDAYDETLEYDYNIYNQQEPIATLNVSLLKSDGSDTGYGSGINWGIRKNGTKRNQNQAYIPYNVKDRIPGFFPDRKNPDDENCPIFRVITKDFGSFHMRMAQAGNKALHSAESNALLGEWIRKRLNAPSGGYITKQMLELYGKTYVTFRKYEDGTYLLDF